MSAVANVPRPRFEETYELVCPACKEMVEIPLRLMSDGIGQCAHCREPLDIRWRQQV
jgi:hypothetical protein